MRGLGIRGACQGLTALLILTCPSVLAWQFPKGCGTRQFNEKLDRKEVEALQPWVNDGHEPWRIDNPELVAHQKLLQLALSVRGFGAHQAPPEQIVRREHYAVYLYKSVVGNKTYRVTVRKFQWLVPIAGKPQWVIWVPTRVLVTDCSKDQRR